MAQGYGIPARDQRGSVERLGSAYNRQIRSLVLYVDLVGS
jgi:hypothetical protein